MVKLIGITSENPDGAKRTRTADPLHAMQVLYQLSYGPKFQDVNNLINLKMLGLINMTAITTIWGHSSVGRAPAWHAGGQRFESAWLHQGFR